MKKIKNICVMFENMDSCFIKGEAIKDISIKNLSVNISSKNNEGFKTEFLKRSKCTDFDMEIYAKDLKNGLKIDDKTTDAVSRLNMYNDLVDMDITFDDGSKIAIDMPYYTKDDFDDNIWMKAKFVTDSDGHKLLKIAVHKPADFEE